MKKPSGLDVAALDQCTKGMQETLVPHFASVFLSFCATEGIDREEALSLTEAYIAALWSTSQRCGAPRAMPRAGGRND